MKLNPIIFNVPSEALAYLRERLEPPLAYFIDMKPYDEDSFPGGVIRWPELEIPEEIFNYAFSMGWTNNFYFMSAHRSTYDNFVLDRTGADFILKHDPDESLYRELEKIASRI